MDGKYTVSGIRYSSQKKADAARTLLGVKLCPKCGLVLSVDQFPADRSRTSGLYPHCKPCLTDYREANRDKRRAYDRNRYRNRQGKGQDGLPLSPA